MNNEKIIQTIKKVLALSSNNPSSEEAQSAALKAQELLAKYHISMAEVESLDLDKVEEIEESVVDVPAKKWKYKLAILVAKNFRCIAYLHGKAKIVFFGHKTDSIIAAETFKYLFTLGDRLGNRAVKFAKAARTGTEGVYNSFVYGFCQGLQEALAEQCTALMIVVPEDVKESYEDKMKFCRTSHVNYKYANRTSAFEEGRQEGRRAMEKKRVEA